MKLKGLLVLCLAVAAGCSHTQSAIQVETPKRPAGQEDVIGLTAEPMDTVRIGIIGIGMRGRGAVYRMSRIEGTKIVAIADLLQENLAAGQERLAKAGRPAAAGSGAESGCRAGDPHLLRSPVPQSSQSQHGHGVSGAVDVSSRHVHAARRGLQNRRAGAG